MGILEEEVVIAANCGEYHTETKVCWDTKN